MKKKHFTKSWFPFIINIFITTFITIVIVISTMYIGTKLDIFNDKNITPLVALFSLILLVISISTVFTFMISLIVKNFIKPVNNLIQAMKAVSKGNFTIRLSESYHEEEIRNMNTSFNKMVKELSSIESLRNDFVVNVSHEFQTPIAAIEGYATLLQEPNLPQEERFEYTQMILESSRQLSALSGNILKLSKLETQEIAPEKKYFYLDEHLRQALLLLENSWSKKNIDIDMDLPTTYCYGCEDLLTQVWINLYSNAIKFTPEYGTIITKLKTTNKWIIVSISDTGIGMNEDVKNRIFEKFYQGDKSRNFEGNGLGLTLVKRIIDLCQYKIEVESKPNFGTTFNIYLPLEVS